MVGEPVSNTPAGSLHALYFLTETSWVMVERSLVERIALTAPPITVIGHGAKSQGKMD